jgi:type 1 glutamine amidotransferase
MKTSVALFASIVLVFAALAWAGDEQPWLVFDGKGKHIVLVAGDDEYRSEEALPQLAKILSKRHGFKCTVLFPIDPKTGEIKPDYQENIPGLENLAKADLMIMGLRFRNLPDEQMKHLVDYIESGRPIIGLRTSTHAFNLKSNTYHKYTWTSKEWQGGFGKQILGETWVNHWGHHGKESTRGLVAKGAGKHPILKGIKDGDIWGPSDVYELRYPPLDGEALIMGQVLKGMKSTDEPVEGKKNKPMMPVAWTRSYKWSDDKTARIFTTTMGSATDFESEGLRRLVVNAAYWSLGMEGRIPDKSNVDIVGEYRPTQYGFGTYVKGRKPADYK